MEGDSQFIIQISVYDISIHSLRMEGDLMPIIFVIGLSLISIHSLRMEGDNIRSFLGIT